ncbi:MAG: hypothetical protein RBU30_22730, partial [Polyangia bacterium]|nr:hypothetical protein [Polyangia bacterium]
MLEPIQTFLAQLEPTECCQHGGLWAVRLALHPPPTPVLAVSSLGAAVKAGVATLSEVGNGEVGRILVRNRGGTLLFGMAGELVLGGRQDRVLNSSVLIAPGAETAVHVSCVEPRRWCQMARIQSFQPAQASASTTVRSAVHQTMVLNLHQTGLHSTDQRRVWERVSTTLRRTGAWSPDDTGTLAASMHRHGSRLDEYARACTPNATQVGLALF